MARLTERDAIIRHRWSEFLKPLVGSDCPVSVAELTEASNEFKARSGEERAGDNRAEVYAWKAEKQTPRAETVFAVGEALRGCGIAWSTGFGALWAAGYISEFARAIACLSQAPSAQASDMNFPPSPPPCDISAIVGTHAPLYASPNLASELLRHKLSANANWLVADRRAFGAFIGSLPAGWSEVASRKNGHALLESAASLGNDDRTPIETRERLVWIIIVEWAIGAASPVLREGRIAAIAGLYMARPHLLIEAARDAAISDTSIEPIAARPESFPQARLSPSERERLLMQDIIVSEPLSNFSADSTPSTTRTRRKKT